jgi:hypothetical protein
MEDYQLTVARSWAEDPEDKNALYYQFERAARLRSMQYPVRTCNIPSKSLFNRLTSNQGTLEPPEETVFFLTSQQANGLKVSKVHTVYAMPEYPETAAMGVAYCINVRNLPESIVKNLHKDVSVFELILERLVTVYRSNTEREAQSAPIMYQHHLPT